MRTIILAAGQGYKLGNFNKLLLKDPATGLTTLDLYQEIFSDTEICIVVGYKAVHIMNSYPKYKYIYNPDWHITKDSYSLGLALSEEPCYIIHSDLIISENIRKKMDFFDSDCAVTMNRDDRTSSSLNCGIAGKNINTIYQGELINSNDPELIGIYKIINSNSLKILRVNCLKHKNLFIGQNISLNKDTPLAEVNVGNKEITIIKTPLDFMNFIENRKIENE